MADDDRPTAWDHMLDPGTEAIRRMAAKGMPKADYDKLPSAKRAEFEEYTQVLMFMHWAWIQPEGKKKPLGELLVLGCKGANLPLPEPKMKQALLVLAFKLCGTPFPKGGI